jgi:ABC-type transporter Mla subunit MlaD
LAVAGQGLGPTINRQIVNSQKVLDVNAAHDADTRQFLADLAKLADQLGVRADDIVATANDLNTALPTLNSRSDKLNSLLGQTARLSNDLADLLRNNKAFIDASFAGGQETLNVLFDHRNDIVPLVVGLREYLQTLTEITRLDAGDGTLMAAVKALTAGDACKVFTCTTASSSPAGSALTPADAGSLPLGAVTDPVASGSTVRQLLEHLARLGSS